MSWLLDALGLSARRGCRDGAPVPLLKRRGSASNQSSPRSTVPMAMPRCRSCRRSS